MAGDLYQMIATKNEQLAKFFDANHNIALAVKKFVGMISRMATEDHFDASQAKFEVYNPKGNNDIIIIRIVKPGQ